MILSEGVSSQCLVSCLLLACLGCGGPAVRSTQGSKTCPRMDLPYQSFREWRVTAACTEPLPPKAALAVDATGKASFTDPTLQAGCWGRSLGTVSFPACTQPYRFVAPTRDAENSCFASEVAAKALEGSTAEAKADAPPEKLAPEQPSYCVLNKEEVKAVVRTHVHDVRNCYSWHLSTVDASATGRLKVHTMINSKGEATDVFTSGPFPAHLLECVRGLVYGWTFPPPREGSTARFVYPFMLNTSREFKPIE